MSVTTSNGATLRFRSVTGRTCLPSSPQDSTLGGGSDIPGRFRGAAQAGPYFGDPAVEVVERARVVDHDVGDRQPLLPARLRGHAVPRLGRGHAAAGDEPGELHVGRHV